MYRQHRAALAALTLVSTPCAAFDNLSQLTPGVMFYLRIPLEAVKAKGEAFSAGLAFQGKHDYETVKLDSRMINHFTGGGIEAKWIIVGLVGAGAVAAVAMRDKSTTNSQHQQQQAQAERRQAQQTGGGSSGNGGGNCPPTPCP